MDAGVPLFEPQEIAVTRIAKSTATVVVRLKPDPTYDTTVRFKPDTTPATAVRLKPDTTYDLATYDLSGQLKRVAVGT
ncbi:MAG: hypothetical protein ABI868_03610 [Acidobacteriota bacterium]